MSVSRQLSKWSLRAMILWGAIEAGAAGYDWSVSRAGELARLAGHGAAMARLDEQARAKETEAAQILAAAAHSSAPVWTLTLAPGETPPQAAARSLRETLLEYGAQAPVVDAAGDASAPLTRVTLTARWREDLAASPRVLAALAARFPEAEITALRLERGEYVSAALTLTAAISAAPAPTPAAAAP